MNWNGWTLERIVILFVSLAYLMMWVQVGLFHYRQNFHHKAMWSPILVSPLLFCSGIVLTFYNAAWTTNLFIAMLIVGAIVGLVGFYLHWRGVGVRVGGYALRNFLIGPPVVLPLMFTAVSGLGLLAVFW
ncbi:hypothetical protein FE782_16060 [Paenibacillus antri]|uniref:Uncharacterized protein n=1 Tax=Paenibacillus antri TaxID=2582848 RepID=A0A5R9GDH5_9BACL|nr:hypothetical protein [Paenibacillus antri]TLS51244.1 hypothetical protein FE782_16060 [Paenibacillus antri]